MNMKEKHFIIRRALSALTAALIACSCTLPLQASASGSQLELGDKFDQYISNAVSDILEGVVSVPKEYRLNDADLIAPRPRRECYGETDSPEILPCSARIRSSRRGPQSDIIWTTRFWFSTGNR